MLTRTILGAALIAAMSPALMSCKQLECGEGTMERDGECVTGEGRDPGPCGDGTHADPAEGGACVPDFPPAVCDPDTTTEIPDPETGVITCQGTGMGCDIQCAPPGPGNVSLCGKLYDVEDDTKISGAATGAACDPASPTADGPCSLRIAFFPALPFAGNPSGTPPLVPSKFRFNDCGNFAAEVEEPMLGFMAIGLDDVDNAEADNWVLAGVALPAPEGTLRNDLVVYGLRHATDQAWTTSAALVGQTFAERGVYVPIFLHGDGAPDSGSPAVPVAGAVVLEDGAPDAAHSYYFNDTDPHIRLMPDLVASGAGRDNTGPNGSALMTDSELVDHSGMGGEPAGCKWPEDLAKAGGTLAGVAFIQRRIAIDTVTEETCE